MSSSKKKITEPKSDPPTRKNSLSSLSTPHTDTTTSTIRHTRSTSRQRGPTPSEEPITPSSNESSDYSIISHHSPIQSHHSGTSTQQINTSTSSTPLTLDPLMMQQQLLQVMNAVNELTSQFQHHFNNNNGATQYPTATNVATGSYATTSPTTTGTSVVTSNIVGTRLPTGATQQPTPLTISGASDLYQNPINNNVSSTTSTNATTTASSISTTPQPTTTPASINYTTTTATATTMANQPVVPQLSSVDKKSKYPPAPQLNNESSRYDAVRQYSGGTIRNNELLPSLEVYKQGISSATHGTNHYNQQSHSLAALTSQHRTNSSIDVDHHSRNTQSQIETISANACAGANASASKAKYYSENNSTNEDDSDASDQSNYLTKQETIEFHRTKKLQRLNYQVLLYLQINQQYH